MLLLVPVAIRPSGVSVPIKAPAIDLNVPSPPITTIRSQDSERSRAHAHASTPGAILRMSTLSPRRRRIHGSRLAASPWPEPGFMTTPIFPISNLLRGWLPDRREQARPHPQHWRRRDRLQPERDKS